MHLAEVAPAGGAAVGLEALAGLLILTGLFLVLGITKMIHGFVHAMFWGIEKGVGWIPFANKVVSRPLHSIEAHITGWLGAAEQGIDHAIGWTWHNMAHLIRWTVHEIEALSYALLVNSIATSLHISRKRATELIQALLHPLRTYQHILRRLHRLEHAALHALRHIVLEGVYPRIHAGEAALDHVIEWDIPRLRARERALARRVGRLWKWVRAHEKIVVTAAFVGAVSVALARLGAGWVRCKNWRRIGKHVCGLPTSLIEDLLGLALGFELLVDPEEIAKVALDVESAFEGIFEQIAS